MLRMLIYGNFLPGGSIPAKSHYPPPSANYEETGYTASDWRRILYFYASPGFVAEAMSVYLATGLRAGKAQPEADEIIRKRMVPLPAAVNMVLSGKIRDAKTISSVLWLEHEIENNCDLRSPYPGRRAAR